MAKDFFSREEIDEIKAAIAAAENHSSGEIRLHLENHCKEDLMDRAAYIFEQLEMHKTKLRNGVLFYLAIEDHQFAILGDVGINQKVPEGFWDEVRDLMQLKEFFPLADDDKNELSDEISFGK